MTGDSTSDGWRPLIPISLVMFIIALDTTMLNVAIPEIVRDLDTSTASVQAAVALYSLVMAALMVGAGRMGDVLGTKRVYTAALVTFGLGTTVAAIAPNVAVLMVGWSLLEGIGAAALIPISLSMIATSFAGAQRAAAFGIVGGVQAVAAATGPILGGFLASNLSWRYAFGLEALVVVAAIVLLRFVADRPGVADAGFDVGGLILWVLGLVVIVLGVLVAGHYGWWDSRRPLEVGGSEVPLAGLSPTPLLVGAGLGVLVAFVLRTLRREQSGQPTLFAIATFRRANYRAGIAVDGFESLLLAGFLFIVPVYLQSGRGYSALESGVALLPFSVAILLSTLLLPRLLPSASPKRIIQIGTALMAVGLVWYRSVALVDVVRLDLVGPFILIGGGVGALLSQVANITLSSVPESETGGATGVYNTGKELGTSLGTAIIGTAMLASFYSFFVGGAAAVAGEQLGRDAAEEVALEFQDAAQRLDDDELTLLVTESLPGQSVAEINTIVDESWTLAHRRALEISLAVVAATFAMSTFLRDPDRREF